MEQNEVSESSKLPNPTDLGTSNSLFSKLIPAYLEYVRVEQDRAVVTVDRYRARLQRPHWHPCYPRGSRLLQSLERRPSMVLQSGRKTSEAETRGKAVACNYAKLRRTSR
jgi:hypothetical protein